MRRKILNWCVLAVTAFLSGCYSSENADLHDANIDAVHQIYSVTHDAEQNESRAYARFRFGGERGTNLELTGESGVECNGNPLSEGNLFGRCYVLSIAGFEENYEFVFTDTEGNLRTNTIRLRRCDFPDDTPETLSRDSRHRLRFAGPPLIEGESIVLLIKPDLADLARRSREDPLATGDKLPNGTMWLGRSTEVGSNEIELTPAALAEVESATIVVEFVRWFQSDLQEGTSEGGVLKGHYRSAPRTIALTD